MIQAECASAAAAAARTGPDSYIIDRSKAGARTHILSGAIDDAERCECVQIIYF